MDVIVQYIVHHIYFSVVFRFNFNFNCELQRGSTEKVCTSLTLYSYQIIPMRLRNYFSSSYFECLRGRNIFVYVIFWGQFGVLAYKPSTTSQEFITGGLQKKTNKNIFFFVSKNLLFIDHRLCFVHDFVIKMTNVTTN